MGSLCGQVNMAWRMNHSTVTLFLSPTPPKADWTEMKAGSNKCQAKQCAFSFNIFKYHWFPFKVNKPPMIKTPQDITVAQQQYRRGLNYVFVMLFCFCLNKKCAFKSWHPLHITSVWTLSLNVRIVSSTESSSPVLSHGKHFTLQ